MRTNRASAYGRILYEQLVKDSCECQGSFCVMTFIEEIKRISVFLQEKFRSSKLTNEQVVCIFEEILKRLSESGGENESYYIKKVTYILLNYLKDNYFSLNINLGNKIFSKYINNPKIKPFINEYLADLNLLIQKSSSEPYLDIAFSLYIQGISEDYNLIKDVYNNNFVGIQNFINSQIEKKIFDGCDMNCIDELCILFETLNQLGIVINIGGEQRKIGITFYKKILAESVKKAIYEYLNSLKNSKINKILEDEEIVFTKDLKNLLTQEELEIISKLQGIYGKLLFLYEGNIDFNQSMRKFGTIEETVNEMGLLTKVATSKINYGFLLKKHAIQFDSDKQKNLKEENDAIISAELSKIYVNLKRIKLSIKILEYNGGEKEISEENQVKIGNLNKERIQISEQIIRLYNKATDKGGNELKNPDETVDDFIKLKKPTYGQLIVIYNLVISGVISVGSLQNLIKYLIGLNGNRSISFQKYKLQTIESIIGELGNRTTLCNLNCKDFSRCINDNRNVLICKDLIGHIERFVSGQKNHADKKGHYFVYHYGKLYLSLAYLFSQWEKPDLLKKAKQYLTIFQEKYLHTLNSYGKKPYKQIDYEKLETEDRIAQIIHNIKNGEDAEYSVETSIAAHIQNDNLARRIKIEEALLSIIVDIQRQKGEYSEDSSLLIQKKICELISESLFDGLCEINLVKNGEKIQVGKFEKTEVIKVDYSDIQIVFTYNSLYESSFRHLFDQEKEFIKKNLILFIVSNNDYLTISHDFRTMIGFMGKLMESKDIYTKGHINRVTDFSVAIGRVLGFDPPELSNLAINAMFHDIGKVDLPDTIMRKTGLLSQEDRQLMDMHSGNGIIEGLNIGINRKYLDGVPHHNKFYAEDNNPSLTLPGLIRVIEKGTQVDVMDFKKLAGNNIPYIARIIMIGDAIDAIASRRVYDKRASLSIYEILEIIDGELLNCSGLKRGKNGIITINPEYWQITEGKEELENVYRININGKHYIPTKKKEIIFDASIVYQLLSNEESYNSIKDQIITSDRENVRQKIVEIENNIKFLREKNIEYRKALKGIRSSGFGNVIKYLESIGVKIVEEVVSGIVNSILNEELFTQIEKISKLKSSFDVGGMTEITRLRQLQKQLRKIAEGY